MSHVTDFSSRERRQRSNSVTSASAIGGSESCVAPRGQTTRSEISVPTASVIAGFVGFGSAVANKADPVECKICRTSQTVQTSLREHSSCSSAGSASVGYPEFLNLNSTGLPYKVVDTRCNLL